MPLWLRREAAILGTSQLSPPNPFHALTCGCGTRFVVGPVEAGSGRELLCSMCRAERVHRAMAAAARRAA